MNYRHAFHAGNFADLLKHTTLTVLLKALLRDPAPLLVIDTHAGAGAYDLGDTLARKTREAEAGIVRLMADSAAPPAFDALKAAVTRFNPRGGVRFYPGSPLLIAGALRPTDRYLGCELRADDHAALVDSLQGFTAAEARLTDGYEVAAAPQQAAGRRLVVIDPPFERPDDYDRILAVVEAAQAAQLAIWLPLKDLETFDSFLRRLEGLDPGGILVAEARLKPLREPLRMNGCAMVLVRPPTRVAEDLQAVSNWIAHVLGGEGALGRVRAL